MVPTNDAPEEATEEPQIRSPAEDALRAAERTEIVDGMHGRQGLHLADADSPLRTPGELSPRRGARAPENAGAAAADETEDPEDPEDG